MKNTFTFLIVLVVSLVHLQAHPLDSIEKPILKTPDLRIYISPQGSPSATGDSLHPIASFTRAKHLVDSLTTSKTGDVYAEVVLFEGTYQFAITQNPNEYIKAGRKLNISIRGQKTGKVFLDGQSLTLSPGSGMIALLGSHISVRNIEVLYSKANGVRFGWNYGGTIINSHDLLVENVTVQKTSGHGIIAGVGVLNASDKTKTVPYAERVHFKNCTVHDAVNYNDRNAAPWGSAIKFNNVKKGIIEGCTAHDNGGEGIDLDRSKFILVQNNVSHDNRANIYLDKVEGVVVQNNVSSYDKHSESGILLSMEVYSFLVRDYYLTDIYIQNNVILNARVAISFWQGTAGATQIIHIKNIHMKHNTIVGKQKSSDGVVQFAFSTVLGKPAPNVKIAQLSFVGNIVSADKDSLSGPVVKTPLKPMPGLTYGNNLWSQAPTVAYDPDSDHVESGLPTKINRDQLQKLVPHNDSNAVFVHTTPLQALVATDFNGRRRFKDSTNAGAFELDTSKTWLSVEDVSQMSLNFVSVYPNPADDQIQICDLRGSKQETVTAVSLVDIQGHQTDLEFYGKNQCLRSNISDVGSGLYLLLIEIDHGRTMIQSKLVVRNH